MDLKRKIKRATFTIKPAIFTLRKSIKSKTSDERQFYRKFFRAQTANVVLELISKSAKARKLLWKAKKMNLYGMPLWMRPNSRKDFAVFDEIFLNKSYSFNGAFERAMSSLDSTHPTLILDVGAHIGLWSIWAKKLFPDNSELICFEPNPENRSILDANLKTHRIDAKIRKEPISERDELIDFYIHPTLNTQSSNLHYSPEMKKPVKMNGITLDSATKGLKEKGNLVVKIDTEGSEIDVLDKGKDALKNAKIVVGEYHFPRFSENGRGAERKWEEFKKFLETHFNEVQIEVTELKQEEDPHFKKLILFLATK